MAKRFALGEQQIRTLRRNDQARRGTPIAYQAPRGAVQQANMHTMRMETSPATVIAQEGIPAATIDVGGGLFWGRGNVEIYVLQDVGDLFSTGHVVEAFNPSFDIMTFGSLVLLSRDWRTGRWIISSSNPPAAMIYFQVIDGFTHAESSFRAELLNCFRGGDPISMQRWALSGIDLVINPEKPDGTFLFAASADACGFAEWHELDQINPGSPFGYWCTGVECTVPA